jgi:hypothetical protein
MHGKTIKKNYYESMTQKEDTGKRTQNHELQEHAWRRIGIENLSGVFLPFVLKQACKKNLTEIVVSLKFNDLK